MEKLEIFGVDENRRRVRLEVTEADVIRSYRGRPGCMCGCRGTYSSDQKLGIRRLKKIVEICSEQGTEPEVLRGLNDEVIISLPAEVMEKKRVNYTVYLQGSGIVKKIVVHGGQAHLVDSQ